MDDLRLKRATRLYAFLPIPALLFTVFGVRVFSPPPGTGPLRPIQSIALPGIAGRLDHMSIDVPRQRLFVAAFGANSVLVINLRTGQVTQTLRGFHGPQGVCFVAQTNRLFVTNGEDGTCVVLDGSTFRPVGTARLGSDADNVHYDADANHVYVGYGSGALGVLHGSSGKVLQSIPLPEHPEGFQLDLSGPRIYVNLPQAGEVAVVDREARRVIEHWPTEGKPDNFPLALDGMRRRLFVGCRHPAMVQIYDCQTGKRLASVPIHDDVDNLYFDGARRRLYAACGAGFVDVLTPKGEQDYEPSAMIATAPGARTALFVPVLSRLYVALPQRGNRGAEVRVFQVTP